MGSYDLPDVPEGLSPEAAQEAINAVLADSRGNAKHPLMLRDHPQHDDFVGRVASLQEAANPTVEAVERPGDDERQEIEEAIRKIEATDGWVSGRLYREHRARHTRLVAERAALYERLNPPENDAVVEAAPEPDVDVQQRLFCQQAAEELARLQALGVEGIEGFDIENVEAWQVDGLRMQRLRAEGDFMALAPMIKTALAEIETTLKIRDLFRLFEEADSTSELKADLAEGLLSFFYDAHAR